MKNVVINSLMNSVVKYKDFDEIKLKEIKYGIESFYLTITKTVVIFSIAYVLNLFETLLVFMCFYTLLRLNGFGLHAKKSWQCWVVSTVIFLLIPYLCLNIFVNKNIQIILALICLMLILKYAPADTEKRPIINRKKRFLHKGLCFVTTFIYIFLLFFLHGSYICNIIFFSVILETIMILPISYKIFGLKYNNYKRYC